MFFRPFCTRKCGSNDGVVACEGSMFKSKFANALTEHVVGARLQRVATSYRESFELAEECGLIDKQLRDDLLPSVGMRNILVHEYLEIDLQKVASAVPLALSCYRRYVQQVAEFVMRVDSKTNRTGAGSGGGYRCPPRA